MRKNDAFNCSSSISTLSLGSRKKYHYPSETKMAEKYSNSNEASSGNISNNGNVTVNVPQSNKSNILITVAVPIVAALLIGVGGAYAKYQFDLWSAPEKTQAQTDTLLGLVKETLDIANSKKVSSDVINRLKKLEIQARAIVANIVLLQKPKGQFSSQADFWLEKDNATILGGTTSFGVNQEYSNGQIHLTVNGKRKNMSAGGRYDFKSKDGQPCFITYIGKFSENNLYGFKIECGVK